ncbi:MAG: hypothetical protein GKS06_03280 [Acidobacteria bacterium]|nr:hypothetical protein [Acidobacteriota bacterium]
MMNSRLTAVAAMVTLVAACGAPTPTGQVRRADEKTIEFTATVGGGFDDPAMAGYHLIVWDAGRAADHALFVADVSDVQIIDALEELGAAPGDALKIDTWDEREDPETTAPDAIVAGPPVEIEFVLADGTVHRLDELISDPGGRGFDMRFGGHRDNIPEWHSGCVVCLYSCPGSKVGNASYTVRWYMKPDSAWRVAVVDKTVPHANFREHGALFWVLRHEKISTPNGARDWTLDAHYIGFEPTPGAEERGVGRDLTERDLRNADLLFLADTYGVYEGDYAEAGNVAALDYSERVYGGLQSDEADIVKGFAEAGGHVIAEFNTFASPTTADARTTMEELLGLQWSGWSGRYFSSLDDDREVPVWARRQYKKQHSQDWAFTGPGYLLVHEDSTLLVLREGADIGRDGLTIEVRAAGSLVAGVLDGMAFNYWFDVVIPDSDSEVPAVFRFDLHEPGAELLRRHGVPAEFPAVTVASTEPLRMYFAGDFSDAGGSLGPHWVEGLPWLNQTLLSSWVPRTADQEPFYWGFYIPLLRNTFAAVQP